MDDVIDGLLGEFEAGRMTRRQLITSLAAAATALASGSSVASPVEQAPAAIPRPVRPAAWKTVWLDHVSYYVADYRKSTAFYRDLMGWEIKTDNGRDQCSMQIGDIGGIIIRNRPGAARSAAASAARGGPPRLTGVIDHVAWGVEPWDTEAVKAELERRGLNPRPDMVGQTFKSFHVKDPDGWDLQITNQRDTSAL